MKITAHGLAMFRKIVLVIFVMAGGFLGGCSTPGKTRMQVNVTQLGPYIDAARSPDCAMPVLGAMPLTTFKEVAIVEAWADIQDDQADVLPALKRKACETGADALVVIDSQHQDIKHFLYQASPNETLTETTEQNVYAGQGEFIKEAEHTRLVGEAGHNGYYLEGVAINYTMGTDKQSSQTDPAPPSRPNS
jgi:hypothetical protein